ncbi:hypothetical protein JXI42_11260 [bacterium]|nr:hypothetical protein [bacterium]
MIFYKELTPIVYSSVKDSGVLLTARYICDPRQKRDSEHKIWEDILQSVAASPDIDFAYPTHRFYDNFKEGKSAPRADEEQQKE